MVHALRTTWNQVYPYLRTFRVDPECPNNRVTYPALRAVRFKRGRARSRWSNIAGTLKDNG